MKIYKLAWICPIVLIIMACNSETERFVGPGSVVPPLDGQTAFSTTKYRFTEGESQITRPMPLAKASQTRRKSNNFSIKSLDQVGKIKVYLGWSQAFPEIGPNWKAAIREALIRWNAVTGTAVQFEEVPNTIGGVGIWLSMNYFFTENGPQDPSVCAEAFPTMDRNVNQITIDVNHLREPVSQLSHAGKVKAVMHVLGQALNIGQTDKIGTSYPDGSSIVHITGTAISDPNSLFLSNTCGSTALFSNDDLKAIRTLYPSGALLHRRSDTHLYSEAGIKLLSSSTISFQQEGDFIIALLSGGQLYGKEGRDGIWYLMTDNVRSFVLLPTGSLAALKYNGSLYVKENGLHAAWQWQSNDVSAMDIEGTRVAAIRTNGSLLAKDGFAQSNQNWITVASGVSSVQLEGNRLGYRTTGKVLHIQEGIGAPNYRRQISTGVDEFQLENVIFLLRVGTNLYGASVSHINSWDGTNHYLHGDVKKFQAEGSRIGIITGTSNNLKVKEGLHGAWADLGTNHKDFRMKGIYTTATSYTLNGRVSTRYEFEDMIDHGISADMLWQFN